MVATTEPLGHADRPARRRKERAHAQNDDVGQCGNGAVDCRLRRIVRLFQRESFFAPLMIGYMAGVVLFVFMCEWAASREESGPDVNTGDASRTIHSLPLPH